MCSHYEAPSPHQVAEAFGVAQFDQVRLDLWPGYIGVRGAMEQGSQLSCLGHQQWSEPPRVSRRPFCLSHATWADSVSC